MSCWQSQHGSASSSGLHEPCPSEMQAEHYVRQSIKAAEFSLCQTKHKNSRTFLVPDKASKQQNFPYAKVASKAAEHSFYKTMHESSLCAQQGTKAA